MKHLAILALAAVAGSASAQLWDQSQLINGNSAGTGTILGQHISMLETGETVFGNGAQGPPTNNVLADDFTLTSASTITGFSIFMYTTGATVPNITGVNWAIGGAPTNTLTTTATTSTFWSVGGKNVYRVNAGDTGSTGGIREIQIATVTGLSLNLSAGTYFLSFSANPGNFSPPLPTSLGTHGLNSQQWTTATNAFTPLVNGPAGADMAFIINGSPVPEPASMAALGLGVLALIRKRRSKKA